MEELEQDEMSFWDHLEELRWTLFRSILRSLFLLSVVLLLCVISLITLSRHLVVPILFFISGCVN